MSVSVISVIGISINKSDPDRIVVLSMASADVPSVIVNCSKHAAPVNAVSAGNGYWVAEIPTYCAEVMEVKAEGRDESGPCSSTWSGKVRCGYAIMRS